MPLMIPNVLSERVSEVHVGRRGRGGGGETNNNNNKLPAFAWELTKDNSYFFP
jgi:hypothetical protein